MRLLYRDGGRLALTPDLQDASEPYAILSHTWLSDEEEIKFEDIQQAANYEQKGGYKKLDFLLNQAAKDGLRYTWADTCCIDKSRGPELDEALNRMFEWYAKSEVCYVFLTDVPGVPVKESRWFTRGWTLQELHAPKVVKFYDWRGDFLGDRSSLATQIHDATDINHTLEQAGLAERFRWSLRRQTKKPEDGTYCLIGLMDVSMRSNYGEGQKVAQQRLLRKIEKKHGEKVSGDIRQLITTANTASQEEKPKITLSALKESLKYEQMFARRRHISAPYPSTCHWIMDHDAYLDWVKKYPFLWIKGKPGAGKSTIMKHLVEEDCNRTIAFFFNARGTVLERSTIGLFRSLIFDLLHMQSDKWDSLIDYIESQRIDIYRPWSISSLQSIFRRCIPLLGKPIRVYLDALDECSNEEVQDMVYFMDDLAKICGNFSICFASRYYPGITIRNCVELPLEAESDHDEDLRAYVKGRLNANDDLRAQVIEKANGVFFWAELVVRMLNQDISAGNIHNVQQRLDQIPTSISALLEEITRDADDRLIQALRWIYHSFRLLELEEFYFAMLTGLPDGGDAWLQPWDGCQPSKDDMRRFLHNCTRGLAEQADIDSGPVWFIHETVRDWLLKDKQKSPLSFENGLEAHDRLKQICFKYAKSAYRRNWHVVEYPFRDYACRYLLGHANMAAIRVPQQQFLLDLAQANISQYVKIRPDTCACLPLVSYRESVPHWLAAFNYPALMRAAGEAGLELSASDSSRTPLMLAFLGNQPATFKAILDCGVDLDVKDHNQQTALMLARSDQHRRLVNLFEDSGQTIHTCDLEYVHQLLRYGASNDSWDEEAEDDYFARTGDRNRRTFVENPWLDADLSNGVDSARLELMIDESSHSDISSTDEASSTFPERHGQDEELVTELRHSCHLYTAEADGEGKQQNVGLLAEVAPRTSHEKSNNGKRRPNRPSKRVRFVL